MIVNLIKEDEMIEEEAICNVIEDVNIKDEEQVQVKFECKINNINNGKEYIGLELISSKDITGIPSDSNLLNPAKVDKLIEKGKIQNFISYISEVPVFGYYINKYN